MAIDNSTVVSAQRVKLPLPQFLQDQRRMNQPGQDVVVQNHVLRGDIERLLTKAAGLIGPLASPEVVARVAAQNADSVWLYSRSNRDEPEGFQALLLLNAAGLEALLSQTLDLSDPSPDLLVRQCDTPEAIYLWANYTPGRLAAAMPRIADHFSSPRYARQDLYGRATTKAGALSMYRLGFTRGVEHQGRKLPDLFIYRRNPKTLQAMRPRYDSYCAHTGDGIHVAHGPESFMQVAAIRSAVYLGEQSCPFAEEFDGNDFAATHLIAHHKSEPAGCMRIRFFGSFAKLERLAVRREFRRSAIAFELVRASVDLCRAKGFRRLYGHARDDLLPFWQRFGFRLKPNGIPAEFSGYRFLEMIDDIEPLDQATSIENDPYVAIRPEGQWHAPGVLDPSTPDVSDGYHER